MLCIGYPLPRQNLPTSIMSPFPPPRHGTCARNLRFTASRDIRIPFPASKRRAWIRKSSPVRCRRARRRGASAARSFMHVHLYSDAPLFVLSLSLARLYCSFVGLGGGPHNDDTDKSQKERPRFVSTPQRVSEIRVVRRCFRLPVRHPALITHFYTLFFKGLPLPRPRRITSSSGICPRASLFRT